MERSGLALCSWLDAAQPLHTRMTGVVPLRTVDAAGPPRIRFERWPLLSFQGVVRQASESCNIARPWLSTAAYPMRFPPPQVSQLEPEPLAKRMAENRRGDGEGG